MERETKELTTPIGGKVVVIKAWLTGRERRTIRNAMTDNVTFEVDPNSETGDLTPTVALTGEQLNKSQDIAMETIVVSVDGNTENVLDAIMDMHEKDTTFITEAINDIRNSDDLDEETKKK